MRSFEAGPSSPSEKAIPFGNDCHRRETPVRDGVDTKDAVTK